VKKWLILFPFLCSTPVIIVIAALIFVFILLGGVEEEPSELTGVGTIQLSEIGENEIPKQFMEHYKKAGEAYGVPWTLLAAIHRVETAFSTNLSESYAGAIGATQFMPCTWVGWQHPTCSGLGKGNIDKETLLDVKAIAQYGGYGVDGNGDPMNIDDAMFSTANYLAASSAKTDKRKAVFTYNHSQKYVADVLGFYESYTGGYTEVSAGAVEVRGDIAWPVPHTKNVTSTFGQRWGKLHAGIDIAGGNDLDKPIVSFMPGKVIVSELHGALKGSGYGYLVIVDHGKGVTTRYGHLSKKGIPAGTEVEAGQQIGTMGNTGHSFGVHLYFEVRINDEAVDPMSYVKDFSPKVNE
jgi:hypothetical protein